MITIKQVRQYICDECNQTRDPQNILTIKGTITCADKVVEYDTTKEICWVCLGKKFGADWIMNQEDYITLKCRAEAHTFLIPNSAESRRQISPYDVGDFDYL